MAEASEEDLGSDGAFVPKTMMIITVYTRLVVTIVCLLRNSVLQRSIFCRQAISIFLISYTINMYYFRKQH